MSAFGLARQLGIAPRRGAGLHRAVLLALSRRARLHGAHARSRRASTATSRPCSAAACTCANIRSRNQAPARRRRARGDQRADAGHRRRHHQARDGRRSTRWLRGAARTRADADAGARRTGVRGRRRTSSTTLLAEVRRAHGRRRRNCACRWWSTAASAPTGTRRTEAAGQLETPADPTKLNAASRLSMSDGHYSRQMQTVASPESERIALNARLSDRLHELPWQSMVYSSRRMQRPSLDLSLP